MAFDQATRNKLQKFVSDARGLLVEEFSRQMQHDYGMDPDTGSVSAINSLSHLTDSQHQTAKLLRETMAHYQASSPGSDLKEILGRIVREQGFTVLNRLCAQRMAEARGILIESIAKGYNSKGFQLYARLAGTALGETGDTYRNYLFSIFDEFSIDLAVLFDRYSPMGRLFPKETALLALLSKINDFELESLWAEDETIGWIYQYFNSAEERRQMRSESQAPRNSRELAVRNQFFTPRYVVEFLTDNTLGRIWYEMTQGQTILKDQCRYLVRRPDEVLLSIENGPVLDWLQGKKLEREPEIAEIANAVNGYLRAGGLHDGAEDWFNRYVEKIRNQEAESFTTQEILDFLFVLHRADPFCEGLLNSHNNEVRAVFQILKTRIEKSRQKSLTQEELLKLPVFIPLRAKKDPRDIKVLDPACGSGHFLLYAFILLLTIYSEAWDQENDLKEIPTIRSKGLRPLREIYDSKESFMADVPRLIIEYNLHGIDIDPRAVQIAGLSLWLCAQRSWKEQNVKPADRSQIKKSNIVCAEPMPGEKEFLKAFSETLKPRVLGQLVEIIFEKMELAGEVGSLLKIEEEIEEAVEKAREEFNKELLRRKEETGYLPGFAPKIKQRSLFDFADLPDKTQFWQTAEEKILGALRNYAEQAEAEDGSRLRLFAEDAAKGFAFIDLCRKQYDVLLMNPPYGEATPFLKQYLINFYPKSHKDLYSAFFEKALRLLTHGGFIGALTSRTFLQNSSFAPLREEILLAKSSLKNIVDFGFGVLDGALVETCATTLAKTNLKSITHFYRLQGSAQADDLLQLACSRESSLYSYVIPEKAFTKIKEAPFTYWLPLSFRRLLAGDGATTGEISSIRQGLATGDDFRFIRAWWEISNQFIGGKSVWQWLSKGGEYSPWFFSIHLLVYWKNDGQEIRNLRDEKGKERSRYRGFNQYFKPGLTYPFRTVKGFNARVLPKGCIFTVQGPSVISNKEKLPVLLAYLNSIICKVFLQSLTSTGAWQVGVLQATPYIYLDNVNADAVGRRVLENIEALYELETFDELSPYFERHFIIDDALHKISLNYQYKIEKTSEIIHRNQSYIDKKYADSLNLTDRELSDLLMLGSNPYESIEIEMKAEENGKIGFEQPNAAISIMSYIVGLIFGRWDVRIAIDPSLSSKLTDPFSLLPASPTGMLVNPDGLPAEPNQIVSEDWLRARPDTNTLPPQGTLNNLTMPDAEYPIRIAWNGILVDDPGLNNTQPHRDDIVRCVREVLDLLWKDKTHEIEQEACENLGVSDLRDYFRKPAKFFQDHLKRYSKSRRQAPIYWPLSTSSGSYTLWLYYHRLTDQTLYTCVNNFVDPKLKQVTDDMENLQKKTKRTSQEETDLEKLSDFELELKDFREELLRIAKFWKPDLNDGVQITAAPLWKLFQHKPWQKKLKQTWKDLEKGKYDWAHLAYSIWPERVIRASHKDRSYAIAHDLEDDLWEEIEVGTDRQGNPKTKWVPKKLSKKELEKIIQEKMNR